MRCLCSLLRLRRLMLDSRSLPMSHSASRTVMLVPASSLDKLAGSSPIVVKEEDADISHDHKWSYCSCHSRCVQYRLVRWCYMCKHYKQLTKVTFCSVKLTVSTWLERLFSLFRSYIAVKLMHSQLGTSGRLHAWTTSLLHYKELIESVYHTLSQPASLREKWCYGLD